MYYQYFHFKIAPFSLTPNPRIFYKSPGHRAALAHLLYGFDTSGGFVALTGEVGTGKTTLCRHLVGLVPDHVDVALIVNPKLDFVDLLSHIFDELGIEIPKDGDNLKDLITVLKQHLLKSAEKGRQTVVIIDEAQNLNVDALEHLRLLSNIETDYEKLLKIILVGQPELTELLARKDLRQLEQRITARYNLTPLTRSETKDYIHHRLSWCGGETSIFPNFVIRKIHRYSGGIPRLINALCDRALMSCYVNDIKQVDNQTIDSAAHEVLPNKAFSQRPKSLIAVAAGLAALGILGGAGYYFIAQAPSDEAAASVPPTSSTESQEFNGVAPMVADLSEPKQREIASVADDLSTLPHKNGQNQFEIVADDSVGDPQGKLIYEMNVEERISGLELNLAGAIRRLADQWGLKEISEHDICSTAKMNQLRCLAETSDWDEFRKLNRPAIFKIIPADGKPRYITIVGLSDQNAFVELSSDQKYAFPIDQLLPLWKGWYAMFWKPPVPNGGLIKPGSYSESVRWLRERLGEPASDSGNAENLDYYSNKLRLRVAAYQRDHGLYSDGVVGLRTVISLNDTSNRPNIPRLNKLKFDNQW